MGEGDQLRPPPVDERSQIPSSASRDSSRKIMRFGRSFVLKLKKDARRPENHAFWPIVCIETRKGRSKRAGKKSCVSAWLALEQNTKTDSLNYIQLRLRSGRTIRLGSKDCNRLYTRFKLHTTTVSGRTIRLGSKDCNRLEQNDA